MSQPQVNPPPPAQGNNGVDPRAMVAKLMAKINPPPAPPSDLGDVHTGLPPADPATANAPADTADADSGGSILSSLAALFGG